MPLRGRYKSHSEAVKQKILAAAESGKDWIDLAEANDVPYKTAHYWLATGSQSKKSRGGGNNKKITEQHVAVMLQWLEDDCQLTLKQLRDGLEIQFGVAVSPQAVGKRLDGCLFTIKKVHYVPQGVNTPENKQVRREFVRSAMDYVALGKTLIYVDETNYNLFCRRTMGRSLRGKRAVVKMPNCKGPNLHIIGGMSTAGDIYWERRRGAYKKDACRDWFRRCMQHYIGLGMTPDQIVFVFDNAPVHSQLETLLQEPQFATATMLRLAPYSPMLNPIEHVWSEVKSRVRAYLREHFAELLAGDGNMTTTEFRLRFLENAADEAMAGLNREKCRNSCDHVQEMYPRALDLQDMLVGV